MDLFTTTLLTAIVCNVAGAVYLVETLLRRDEGAGRAWSLAYLSGMATTVAYMMWAAGIGGFVAVAAGNALFVSTMGCMWLGSRRFNHRRMPPAVLVVVAGGLLTAVAVIFYGPDGGGWAGWPVMGAVLIVLSVCAAIETVRRPMGRIRTSWALAVVLAVAAAYYAVRLAVFMTAGPESDLFAIYFGSNSASIVTVTLTIVAVVVTSVLRATRADLRAYAWMSRSGVTSDGIMLGPTFASAVTDITERAGWRGELVGVISVRVEDLRQIATAFGMDVAGDVEGAWRQGVRRFAPSTSFVGEDDGRGLLVATVPATAAEARRQAAAIYRGLFDTLGAVTGAVIPVVGVGVALSETVGYDTEGLITAAREAAMSAAVNPDSSVVFGGSSDAARRLIE
ncbi:MAG: hypothetical protein QM626_13315 [Microbacterium sp.]|uniref:hypothetical protein n=1 Tax=Microbacterium sp. TaxID=51671 RepID=UPI0039E61D6D